MQLVSINIEFNLCCLGHIESWVECLEWGVKTETAHISVQTLVVTTIIKGVGGICTHSRQVWAFRGTDYV